MTSTYALKILDPPKQQEPQPLVRRIRRLFPNGCNRVLLINPPMVTEEDFDLASAKNGRYAAFPPYGIGLLSRNIQNAGYASDILDLNYELLLRAQTESSFRFKVWQQLLDEKIRQFRPDTVGITCMFSLAHYSMKAVAERIKTHHGNLPVIAGGVHNSNNPKGVLETTSCIDLILKYEADNSLVYLLEFINGKMSQDSLTQIAAITDDKFVYLGQRNVPSGDELNLSPEYHNLPIGNYSNVGKIGAYHWLLPKNARTSTILANRGCRAQCTFCSVANFNGKGVRTRSEITVADEIQRLAENYGIAHFMWLDDDLFTPGAVKMFSEIARRNLHITWDASNGVIASAATPEIIHAAHESGCIGLTFGIESGNPEILRAVKKPSGVRHFRKVAEILKRYPGIYVKGFLMVGFPDETVAQIWDTINLAREILLDWYPIQVVTFLAGTEMTNGLVKKGVIDEHSIIDARFFSGATGGQRQREESEKISSCFIAPEVLQRDKNYIPTQEEIRDIWFLMDYLVNYERILQEENPIKLKLKRLMLIDICERMSVQNPMSNLFLGIVETKLGMTQEAVPRFERAKLLLRDSAFWQVRFKALDLNALLK